MAMRNALAALVMMLAALPVAQGGEAYPVPHEENQVFFVQRSMNSNTVVYAARLAADGRPDPGNPVDVYWRRYNDEGQRQELSFLERTAAYGVKTQLVAGEPSAFEVHVVSYPERSAILRMVNGRPQLEMKIAGKPARLDHAYLHVDESARVPRVLQVDIFGQSLATGGAVRESFRP